jgi:hypothetical protein
LIPKQFRQAPKKNRFNQINLIETVYHPSKNTSEHTASCGNRLHGKSFLHGVEHYAAAYAAAPPRFDGYALVGHVEGGR